MNLIYLHGFKSSAQSIKGQLLKHYCEGLQTGQMPPIQMHLPDLNVPPEQALQQVSALVEHLGTANTALVGSSLGGFYALQLAAKHQIAAVLINPAMQPWTLFRQLFSDEQLPFAVTETWSLDHPQLDALEQTAIQNYSADAPILVLLQQGDEVLDYHDAEAFFSQPATQALLICETNGNHGMDDFAEKMPMIVQFLMAQQAGTARGIV